MYKQEEILEISKQEEFYSLTQIVQDVIQLSSLISWHISRARTRPRHIFHKEYDLRTLIDLAVYKKPFMAANQPQNAQTTHKFFALLIQLMPLKSACTHKLAEFLHQSLCENFFTCNDSVQVLRLDLAQWFLAGDKSFYEKFGENLLVQGTNLTKLHLRLADNHIGRNSLNITHILNGLSPRLEELYLDFTNSAFLCSSKNIRLVLQSLRRLTNLHTFTLDISENQDSRSDEEHALSLALQFQELY